MMARRAQPFRVRNPRRGRGSALQQPRRGEPIRVACPSRLPGPIRVACLGHPVRGAAARLHHDPHMPSADAPGAKAAAAGPARAPTWAETPMMPVGLRDLTALPRGYFSGGRRAGGRERGWEGWCEAGERVGEKEGERERERPEEVGERLVIVGVADLVVLQLREARPLYIYIYIYIYNSSLLGEAPRSAPYP